MSQTLLLADDSVTIQRVIELTFADEDISVTAVGNGDHAIASIGKRPPDIVLAAIGMPGRSGYEVARHIKTTPALAHIPVILLTGAFEPIDQVRAAEVRCDGVLIKPFEPQVVIQRVKELLAAVPPATGVPVLSEVAAPPPAPATEAVARLDDYFERLDQAFAARSFDPLTALDPVAALPESPFQPMATESSPTVPEGSGEAVSGTLEPVLAGAFSALLEAEQSGSELDAFADWLPDEPQQPAGAPAVLTEAAIEAIVRRVLDRLSETVVRDAVATIASATAERLVLEEIERIKRNIK